MIVYISGAQWDISVHRQYVGSDRINLHSLINDFLAMTFLLACSSFSFLLS